MSYVNIVKMLKYTPNFQVHEPYMQTELQKQYTDCSVYSSLAPSIHVKVVKRVSVSAKAQHRSAIMESDCILENYVLLFLWHKPPTNLTGVYTAYKPFLNKDEEIIKQLQKVSMFYHKHFLIIGIYFY